MPYRQHGPEPAIPKLAIVDRLGPGEAIPQRGRPDA